jgi:transcription elongation factor Elf1
MSNLIIKNGKFYKGNIEVKPEFGNVEQIRALREAERKANEKKIEAKLIQEEKTYYYATIEFTCPDCKKYNEVEVFEDDPSDYHIDNADVNNIDVSCAFCDTDFTIEADKTSKGNMGIVLSYTP